MLKLGQAQRCTTFHIGLECLNSKAKLNIYMQETVHCVCMCMCVFMCVCVWTSMSQHVHVCVCVRVFKPAQIRDTAFRIVCLLILFYRQQMVVEHNKKCILSDLCCVMHSDTCILTGIAIHMYTFSPIPPPPTHTHTHTKAQLYTHAHAPPPPTHTHSMTG